MHITVHTPRTKDHALPRNERVIIPVSGHDPNRAADAETPYACAVAVSILTRLRWPIGATRCGPAHLRARQRSATTCLCNQYTRYVFRLVPARVRLHPVRKRTTYGVKRFKRTRSSWRSLIHDCMLARNFAVDGLGSSTQPRAFHSVPVSESATEPTLVAAYLRAPGFLRSRPRQYTFSHCACIKGFKICRSVWIVAT